MGGPVVYGQAGSDDIVEMLKEAHEDKNTRQLFWELILEWFSCRFWLHEMRSEKAKEKGIPVVVSMGTLAASVVIGFLLSWQDLCWTRYHHRSIGVYGTMFSFEKIFDWMGINYDGYSTTKWGTFDIAAMDLKELENFVRAEFTQPTTNLPLKLLMMRDTNWK